MQCFNAVFKIMRYVSQYKFFFATYTNVKPKKDRKTKRTRKTRNRNRKTKNNKRRIRKIEIEKTQLAREIAIEETEKLEIGKEELENLDKIQLAREIARKRPRKSDIEIEKIENREYLGKV